MTEYSLPIADAMRLADLVGIRADLQRVVEYCDRMIERYAGAHLKKCAFDIIGFTTHVDFIDWEALSTATCIAYARCFASGTRTTLDPHLLDNQQHLKVTHNFILALRDRHVAHSVNAFEQNSVTVRIEETYQSGRDIGAVAAGHERRAGLSFDSPARIRELALWWLGKVDDEIGLEKARVLAIAQGMPLDEIRAFGALKSGAPGEVHKPRKTYGRSRKRPR